MMRFLLAVFFVLPIVVFAQPVGKTYEERAYSKAIEEYIQAASSRSALPGDTLLIGKRPDLPKVKLPGKVGKTRVLLVTTEEADKIRRQNTSLVFVNLVSVVTRTRSEFLFVTFYPGYVHQYDCTVYLKYNPVTNAFMHDSLAFKDYAFK